MKQRRYANWHLRAWRKHRGWTQQRLADETGIARSRVAELESGKERYNQDLLEALALALSTPGEQVTPADLLSRRPGEPRGPLALWGRIPDRERARAERLIGPILEEFADQQATKPPARKKQDT
jgi:transcriptional regulator with XRE-family HTH domain